MFLIKQKTQIKSAVFWQKINKTRAYKTKKLNNVPLIPLSFYHKIKNLSIGDSNGSKKIAPFSKKYTV